MYILEPIITMIRYWQRNRHVDQWNKIVELNMNICNYSHLILTKRGKKTPSTGEKVESSTNGAGKTGCPHVTLDLHLSPYTKMKSKWTKGLNLKPETLKLRR